MHPISLWVSLHLNEFGHYHGETTRHPSEWGLVATDSELAIHLLIN